MIEYIQTCFVIPVYVLVMLLYSVLKIMVIKASPRRRGAKKTWASGDAMTKNQQNERGG